MEIEVYYEKCRVILSALENAPDGDRQTLIWMLEECFEKLGESIEKVIGKCPMR